MSKTFPGAILPPNNVLIGLKLRISDQDATLLQLSTLVSTMPKRKHDEISSSEGTLNATTARALRLQKLQVNGVLDRSTKSLFRSLKAARGFERQKLGRRQKTAKADSNATTDTARLEAEVTALKSLDLASTAEIHLYKSLLRIKAVASAPALPHHVQATVDALKKPQQVASANVQARLFKSGPVQAAMAEALNGMRAALGIEELKPSSKKRLRAKDYANGNQANDANRPKVPKSEGSAASETRAQDEDEWCGLSTPESPENREDHVVQDDDDNDEGVDYKIYAPRLAASSDEGSIEEEDAEGQNHDRDEPNDMSITDESDDPDASPEQTPDIPKSTRPTPIPKPKRTNPPLNTTTFLPSLSFSGYRSGSDSSSSFSDNDNNNAAAKIHSRKNRMGQQARRALWEKKFGRNANHVRKGARGRDQGWDARKGAQGAVDGREGGKRGRGRGRGGFGSGGDAARGGGGGGGGRFAKRTGANSDPVVARKAKPKTAAEGPLHPSWEAARKVKEQKTAVPFQGKKVVFD